MISNKSIKSAYKLRSIAVTALLFIFYGGFSQTDKINESLFTSNIKGGINVTIDNNSVPMLMHDYNSSRSNRPKPIAWTDAATGNDTVPVPLYAQDYNSSRSNKPSPMREIDDTNANDSVPRHAQDYNSSRSNKPRPVFDTAEKDTAQVPLHAQDYNSSRSNKPSPIRRIDDINDIDNDENGVVVIGTLTTIDLKSRSFELIDKNKQKITGQFQPRVTNGEIKKLRREFLNKKANIHVKINKTKLETGKEIVDYEL